MDSQPIGASTIDAPTAYCSLYIDLERLADIQCRGIDPGNHAGIDQRNANLLVSDWKGCTFGGIVEADLEREIFFGIAIVGDVDLVERIRIELVEVGSSLRILERDVVREK